MHARKSSDTAILIARSILLSSREPTLSKLVATGEEEALRCMAAAHVEGGWFAFAEKRPRVRKLLLVAERFLLGGIFAHYLARKRWIERELRGAIAEGIRQVIVVGAGYDALAWRLHREFPRVSFVEIDHPATQVRKLAAMGMPANLHLLPADLSRDLPSHVLSRSGSFVPGEASAVIAEGLTMYFREQRVTELLRSFAAAAGKGGKVIFTFMETSPDGGIHFRGESPMVGWWLRSRGEPFLWGCRRDLLGDFLDACGLRPRSLAGHDELKREILCPLGADSLSLARGECLCLATPVPS